MTNIIDFKTIKKVAEKIEEEELRLMMPYPVEEDNEAIQNKNKKER